MNYYPWLKAVHVLAIIAWMAGLLYLPRLFVYHAQVGPGTPQSETFKVMERRLLRAIVNPAMNPRTSRLETGGGAKGEGSRSDVDSINDLIMAHPHDYSVDNVRSIIVSQKILLTCCLDTSP